MNDKRQIQLQNTKVVLPCSKTYEFVSVSEIIRCEGLQNYSRVFLENNTQLISSINIGSYKELLEPFGFFCCHKSHVINEQKILRYYKDGNIELLDGTLIPVSRRKREVFQTMVINKIRIENQNTFHQVINENKRPVVI